MPVKTAPTVNTTAPKDVDVKVEVVTKPKIEKLSELIMNPADVIAKKVNEIIDMINK